MELAKLLIHFECSSAIKLLRAANAPFIVAFLIQQFKQAGQLTMNHSDLLPDLASYLEEIHEAYPEKLTDRPETYLTEWSSGERRWLQRNLEFGARADSPPNGV